MIGVWNYPDDPSDAAQKISRGEEGRVMTKLAEAVAEVEAYARAGEPERTLSAATPSLEVVPN